MTERVIIANFNTGYETDKPPILINNDAFPVLENAYLFRGRILKKGGASTIGRLQTDLIGVNLGTTDGSGHFSGNLLSLGGLSAPSSIVLGSISITVSGTPDQVFEEPVTPNGILTNGALGTGTINYATGAITLTTNPSLVSASIIANFSYYPNLPGMGIEDYYFQKNILAPINFPDTIYFNTTKAFQFDYSSRQFYDVAFYKMPDPKNPVTWSGENWQQFWSQNFQQALFVTNAVPGFNFKNITDITQAATAEITIIAHGLNVNDKIWINEVQGMVEINALSATVLTVSDVDTITVDIDTTTFTAYTLQGIAQYLTTGITGQDGIKWYDGDGSSEGFVNFAPPLSAFNISTNPNPTYLLGCRFLIAYQGQMLAIGTFEGTSSSAVVFYPNRVRYSQLGTVFYTDPVPNNQTFEIDAWYSTPGKGGFFNIQTNEQILTAAVTEEVLILGLERSKRRVIGTNNPLQPFIIQTINPELGDEATHATIALNNSVLSVGDYGFLISSSYTTERYDQIIPDYIYQIQQIQHGTERICGIRDFRNEFIYITFPLQGQNNVFPTRSLLFNYRDNNFAVFKEQYTTYGSFREQLSVTWRTLKSKLGINTWNDWTGGWNQGKQVARYPFVAGANQQGFIMKKDASIFNGASHYISNFSSLSVNQIIIDSPNHCLEAGNFIYIQSCLGMTNVNDIIWKVFSVVSNDRVILQVYNDPPILPSGSYLGGGVFSILDNINVKTKMFSAGWKDARGSRIGNSRYLFSTTAKGECTVNLFTSQNPEVPQNGRLGANGIIGGNTIRTRPDNNLGLYRTSNEQDRIWHQLNASITGETIQIGFTYSDDQMQDIENQRSKWELHAIIINFYANGRVLR